MKDSCALEEHLAKAQLQFRLAGIAVKRARSVYAWKRECSAGDIEKMEKLTRLVECHYRSDKAVVFYSAQLGLSVKTLNRLCSFLLGQTVYQLVMDRRLREARKLLVRSEIGIREVAAGAGFKNVSCFSRFFKGMTGMSPRAYRYQARRNSC
ncbi:AraC family transcriptional regulator [Pedobacter jeongneungensis]|uniref:helix-turn-helix domain-containing protein n=1 Tax=Pedobacter jeongneungensis TaxID=947309 RepID=UPI0031EB770F